MIGFPKPRRRVFDRAAERRERDRRAAEFRRQIWRRDGGICQHCRRLVRRTLELVPEQGQVHHRLTRGAHPEARYDVANGILLCGGCHRDQDVIQLFRMTGGA